ncbi:MAG: RES domain-containing protein [Hyphomicrobiales bacterium]|nr:RES domain-containing protein [Hyphomicrobiales bacterium]MBV9112251.1 RES domain-containing protein [Hyphomicrobiales bacterium]MBV9517115.1 RES domain-containing protein [Hyphomicrobiales bacterium]
MTALPRALGGSDGLIIWRLDQRKHATTWDNGEGSFLNGGRWNSKGIRAVYCSFDPATAILEVAVHKGFSTLDTVPFVITAATIADDAEVHVVKRGDVPNPNWLRPGVPSAGQQAFGDDLLRRHRFVAIPSAVSNHSWNLILDPLRAKTFYSMHLQEPFALDTRLHPAR